MHAYIHTLEHATTREFSWWFLSPLPFHSAFDAPPPSFLDSAAAVVGQGRGGTVIPGRSDGGGGGVRLGCAGVGGPGGLEAAGGALREPTGVSESKCPSVPM